MPTFGELIREKGIPVRKLAKDLKVSATSISKWQHERVPREGMRDQIERYFGVEGIIFGQDAKEKAEATKDSSLRFVDLMSERDLSAQQLAKGTGLGVSSIFSWMNSKRPSKRSRKIIEDYLQVTRVIFGGDRALEEEKPKGRALDRLGENGSLKTVTLTASEEHTLMQVIRIIGFDEALRRLVN